MLTKMLLRGGLLWAAISALVACAPGAGGPAATASPLVPTVITVASATAENAPTVAPTTETPAPGATPAPLGALLNLGGGQRAAVEGGLTLTFQAVVEDSRCPAELECVWAGQAKIALRVEAAGQAPATITLSTLPEQSTPTPEGYPGYMIELLDVAPYPQRAGEHPPLEGYEATLRVSAVGG